MPTLIYNLLYVRGHLTGLFCYPIRSKNFESPDLRLFLWHTEMDRKLGKENKKKIEIKAPETFWGYLFQTLWHCKRHISSFPFGLLFFNHLRFSKYSVETEWCLLLKFSVEQMLILFLAFFLRPIPRAVFIEYNCLLFKKP